MPPPETPGHSQAILAQSFVRTLLLYPGSWCTQGFLCALQESVSLVLWKFCNQIPVVFKVKFPGGSQFFCQIPRLGNLLWALELLQQCENFFGIIVLQFVGHLLSASKFGKLSSGHRTGKGQFSFQSQRKAMPKNVQSTTQMHSSHTLAK